MSAAFLFPGQGSQVPGMLHALPEHGSVRGAIEEACEFLGRDVFELDTAAALQSTVSVQLALLISGVAVARALISEGGEPTAVAGMSAGAFSAAVVSGALKFTDALRLIRQRAEMMSSLYPQGYGLSIIIGLTEEQVLDITRQAGSANDPLYISNINAPRQIGIAGSNQAMVRALAVARSRGARKAICLNVSVPSHCPLLEPVAEALKKEMAGMVLEKPRIIYVGNIAGRALRSAEAIAEDVSGNVAHAIRWHDSTAVLDELGCRTFFEMPPGHVLSDLAHDAFKEVRSIAIGKTSLGYAARISAPQSHA
jgi:malonate decarboxylase epsilon subunit